ncbi:MAG: 4-amino-4-deoxy-L-arabinose transferase, partial [Bacteroidetes bacterium]
MNLLQAGFTGLLKDEAYYAYFAKDMQWGYFDHPPLVALLAIPSNFDGLGILGVRFLSVLSVSFSYWLLYQTLSREAKERVSNGLFSLLLLGLPLVNLYGFLTLPDTGTLLFT